MPGESSTWKLDIQGCVADYGIFGRTHFGQGLLCGDQSGGDFLEQFFVGLCWPEVFDHGKSEMAQFFGHAEPVGRAGVVEDLFEGVVFD